MNTKQSIWTFTAILCSATFGFANAAEVELNEIENDASKPEILLVDHQVTHQLPKSLPTIVPLFPGDHVLKTFAEVEDIIDLQSYQALSPLHQDMLRGIYTNRNGNTLPAAMCFTPGYPEKAIAAFEKAIFGNEKFRADDRWTFTATDGSVSRGEPITLTYSFVPDGTHIGSFSRGSAGPSDLDSFMTGIYGSTGAWQAVFSQAIEQWEPFSGVNFVLEPNDDGTTLTQFSGQLGVRGDIRIGGRAIDGNNGTLAFNFFPNTGDMVIDSGDGYFTNTSNNSIRLRNTVIHEVGHGLGFSHTCPVDGTKIMEPFINTGFDGPQFDDILAVQRNYGDDYEENDSIGEAYSLGLIGGSTFTLEDASTDDDSDEDYYSFSVAGSGTIDISLSPDGSSYLEGPQNSNGSCPSGTTFDPTSISDLTLSLIDTDGSTIITIVDNVGAGFSETISGAILQNAGTYYVQVSPDSTNNIQPYTLDLTFTPGSNFPETDLAITKTDGVTSVNVDEMLTYTIAVTNNGPEDADGAVVTDELPDNLENVSWTAVYGNSASGPASGSGDLNETITTLPDGGTATFTVTTTVSSIVSNTFISNTAIVTAPVTVVDSNTSNNSATDNNTFINPSSDPNLVEEFDSFATLNNGNTTNASDTGFGFRLNGSASDGGFQLDTTEALNGNAMTFTSAEGASMSNQSEFTLAEDDHMLAFLFRYEDDGGSSINELTEVLNIIAQGGTQLMYSFNLGVGFNGTEGISARFAATPPNGVTTYSPFPVSSGTWHSAVIQYQSASSTSAQDAVAEVWINPVSGTDVPNYLNSVETAGISSTFGTGPIGDIVYGDSIFGSNNGPTVYVDSIGIWDGFGTAGVNDLQAAIDFLEFAALPNEPEIEVLENNVQLTDGGSTIDLGTFEQNTTNPTLTFNVRNTGKADLTISSINAPGSYSVTENLSTPLATNESDEFTVTLSTASTGVQNATITINNNDTDEGSFEIPLTAMINAPNNPPGITLTNSTLQFKQGETSSSNTNLGSVTDVEDNNGSLTVDIIDISPNTTGIDITFSNSGGSIDASQIDIDCTTPADLYTVTMRVTDSENDSATDTFDINVNANSAPSLTDYTDATIVVRDSLNATTASSPSDSDGNLDTVILTPATFGNTGTASLNANNGTISYTTDANTTPGTYTFTVRATDDCGAITTQDMELTVEACGIDMASPMQFNLPETASSNNTIAITMNGTQCPFTATENESWITLTTSSGTGSGNIVFNVSANTSLSSRQGTITVEGTDITVTQSAATFDVTVTAGGNELMDMDSIAFDTVTEGESASNLEITFANGGTSTFDLSSVTPSGDSEISISDTLMSLNPGESDMLIIALDASAPGDFETDFIINSNDPDGAFTITVTATVDACTVSTTPDTTFNLDEEASTGNEISVTMNGSLCDYTASTSTPWLSITSGATGTESGTVEFEADANLTLSQRVGTIEINEKSISVVQSAATLDIAVQFDGSEFNSGETITVPTLVEGDSVSNLLFTFQNNGTALFDVSSVSPTGNTEFSVADSLEDLGPGESDTLSIALDSSAAGVFQTTFSINSNDPNSPFEINVEATVEACAITSTTPDTTVNLDNLASTGNEIDVVLNGSACEYIASTVTPWLTITSGAAGTQSGTVVFDAERNLTTTQRTGEITINGKTIDVIQEGGFVTLAADFNESSVPNNTGMVDFASSVEGDTIPVSAINFTNNGDANLELISLELNGDNEFSIINGISEIGPGEIDEILIDLDTSTPGDFSTVLTLTTNATNSPYTFTINGTVNDCEITNISPAVFNLGSSQSSNNLIAVTTNGETCPVTATESEDWITLTTDVLNGSGNIVFDVSENTSGVERSGDINIDTTTITVNQSANDIVEVSVNLEGTDIPDGLSGNEAIDFGLRLNELTTPSLTFTVVNEGNVPLQTSNLSAPIGYTITEPLDGSIAVGSSDNFTVAFDSTDNGEFTGDVSFANNDDDENPFNFAITGITRFDRLFCVDNDSETINIPIAESGPIRDVTVTVEFEKIANDCANGFHVNGSTPFNDEIEYTLISPTGTSVTLIDGNWSSDPYRGIVEFTLNDSFAALPTDTMPSSGDFTPSNALSAFEDEEANGTWQLVVTDTAAGNALNHMAHSLEVEIKEPDIAVFVDDVEIQSGSMTLDYGTVAQGSPRPGFSIRIQNVGDAPLQTSSYRLPTGFGIIPPDFIATLNPGETNTTIYQLDTSNEGTFSDDIMITSNDPDESPFSIPVTGTVEAQPEIAVFVNDVEFESGQGLVDFGTVLQFDTPPTVTVRIDNTGFETLNITSTTLEMAYFPIQLPESAVASSNSTTGIFGLNTDTIGTFNSTITFFSGDADEPMFELPVTGTVVEENIPPTVTLIDPPGAILEASTTTSYDFSGTATDSDGTIDRVEWRINDGSWMIATGTDTWSFTAQPLDENTNFIDVRSFDNEGAVSAIIERVIELNQTPVVTIDIPSGPTTLTDGELEIDISGTASDGDSLTEVDLVEWRLNGGDWNPATGTEIWSATVTDLVNGSTNLIEVRARDNYINGGEFGSIVSFEVTTVANSDVLILY